MRKKFNRTLTLNSRESSTSESSLIEGRRRISVSRVSTNGSTTAYANSTNEKTLSHHHHQYQTTIMQPLDSRVPSDYAYQPGLSGNFVPIRNDFSLQVIETAGGGGGGDGCLLDEDENEDDPSDRYRDEPHWTRETREKVKRVRFVVCLLALFGLALGLMSRLMLNVSIVEMVKRPDVLLGEDLLINNYSNDTTPSPQPQPPLTHTILDYDSNSQSTQDQHQQQSALSIDPLLFAATDKSNEEAAAATTATIISPIYSHLDKSNQPKQAQPRLLDGENGDESHQLDGQNHLANDSHHPGMLENSGDATTPAPQQPQPQPLQDHDGLHFNWSKQDVNIVLGSFYMGYAPGIFFSGSVAERYGAKWPLFVGIFGSALINMLTPLIAQTHLYLLIASRVMLGLIQGSLVPCLYELFNHWLTQTESSIFAPLIKVSMTLGSLVGTLMPGIMAAFKLDWPNLFYIGGLLCLGWSVAWALLATSLPQDNGLVGVNELNRIMRKKNLYQQQRARPRQASITEKSSSSSSSGPHHHGRPGVAAAKSRGAASKDGTPWMLIITNPSVLALTVVKFTYNIGNDFIILQLAVYLRDLHSAPMETISVIASSGFCMQVLLIVFIGWLAKVLVVNQACGMSVTKWRKAFQGSSNFLMALTYLVLAYVSPDLEVAATLMLLVCFFWMLGAGGESMVPYDLSSEYPASIVGFSHSISIFSGVALAAVCDLVVGETTDDPASWSLLFYLISGTIALGGLIFVIVVKAKPFLPGEKVPKSVLKQQQVASISQMNQRGTATNNKAGKLNGYM